MNRMIRVMAGLLVALGASACVSDPSLDYASDPSMIVADPEVVFITHGTQKQGRVRRVDERNRATPTEFTIIERRCRPHGPGRLHLPDGLPGR